MAKVGSSTVGSATVGTGTSDTTEPITTIPQEWRDNAVDDGTTTVEAHEYSLEISDSNGNRTYSTNPTRVNYSPSVNAANSMTVSVAPAPFLEDETYLGGTAKLYVESDLLFKGEIRKVTSNVEGDRDFDMKIRSQGQRLKGDTIERTVSNEASYDAIAKVIDRFNTIDGEHDNISGTTNEVLNDVVKVGGNVRQVASSASSGTATYTNVGTDASAVDKIYAKVYADSNGAKLTVTDGTNSDSKTVTNLDKNQYGEWFEFTPSGIGQTGYDIEFTLNGSSKLIDWLAITNQALKRKVHTPDVSKTSTGVDIYSRSGETLKDEQELVNEPGVVYDANVGSAGGWRARHIAEWGNENDSGDAGNTSDADASGGTAHLLFTGSIEYGHHFNTDDTFEDWGLFARAKWRPRIYAYEDFADWTQNNSTVSSPTYEGSTAVHKTSGTEEGDSFRDMDIVEEGFVFNPQIYIPSSPNGGYVEIVLDGTGSGEEIFGRIDFSGGIEIWDDTGQLATASYSVPTDSWLDCELRIRPGPEDLEFIVEGTSTGKVDPGTSATQIDFARIRDGECYFDALLGKIQDSLDRDIGPRWKTTVDGDAFSFGGSSFSAPHKYEWKRVAANDYYSSWPSNIDSPDIDIELDNGDASPFVSLDCAVLVHKNTDWNEGDFDNSLTNGFLNYPHKYDTGEVQFTPFISDENIDTANLSATMHNISNGVDGWGPVQRIDESTDFPSEYPSSYTTTTNFAYVGVSHAVKFQLCASGPTRDTDNPREGYRAIEVEGYDVNGDHNDLDVIYGRTTRNNRLGAISTLADQSTAYFRWNGGEAEIFQDGLLSTDPDLRKEKVDASVSIEDVYASCEVIGLHDTRSGVIRASSPPPYVDDHKEIRDEGIETEADAVSRAKAFLDKNGSVQYEGSIVTLPTLAPLGEQMAGDNFPHGQPMTIKKVNYSKDAATIELGFEKDVVEEFVSLNTETHGTVSRETGKGMRIPSGPDQSA